MREPQEVARERAEELPGARPTAPFGPDWEVHKVHGKVFMLLTEVTGEPIVILKSDPVESTALREQYRLITPGYHMNKRHWITLKPGNGEGLEEDLVRELVTESYRLVVANNLPRKRWPIDPETFGKPGIHPK
ncbi:MAG: MmcQ/YjbR family DNA-binding protein [Corynebacterium sp.]|uniref:MmcQ/YjbR family DNA-binding protein n=1 Tax=unclassified Corynebacterium TaxID=2624378 RepID=UPI002648C906|nr:MmcQ/YjbR family DNA-binding protein [Corynebacterium sp.]MDN5582540.1 MmcQ/YjbR family DNA-binding protein [Corynebacterium sp.]MDN5720086.1 MmcQ/YjbR family DNA-binding protein [Corynebacterium sp.]MDN6259190.1 MmcQ/YjbR family DNA-binding protein [Corynebacterium sp.]MDN6324413.1 MmcQ/YjbR family DNA-binding protein [Corynebacterium sp.]MDN6509546.1 MmcQ/YjbR family DNA-binding protein [Corynebacterium sp.]